MKHNKAFSLIELLVVIAIIGILAAVVMVSMTAYRSKARSSKALASLSSAIPSMISCWGNTGNVNSPSSGGKICSLDAANANPSYGQWPQIAGDLNTYVFGDINIDNTTNRSKIWALSFSSDNTSGHDNAKICCNSTMSSCKSDVFSSTCSWNNPSN